jgi:hypothetical protein
MLFVLLTSMLPSCIATGPSVRWSPLDELDCRSGSNDARDGRGGKTDGRGSFLTTAALREHGGADQHAHRDKARPLHKGAITE